MEALKSKVEELKENLQSKDEEVGKLQKNVKEVCERSFQKLLFLRYGLLYCSVFNILGVIYTYFSTLPQLFHSLSVKTE